jgi:hypothetical protein
MLVIAEVILGSGTVLGGFNKRGNNGDIKAVCNFSFNRFCQLWRRIIIFGSK